MPDKLVVPLDFGLWFCVLAAGCGCRGLSLKLIITAGVAGPVENLAQLRLGRDFLHFDATLQFAALPNLFILLLGLNHDCVFYV